MPADDTKLVRVHANVSGATGRGGQKALAYTGEGFRFGLPFATDPELTLRSFVESEGMCLGTAFFLGRTHRKGPFMVVAEIQV